jgi:GT2 family glycosyltransferase
MAFWKVVCSVKVTAVITNYNMPERCDALVEHIHAHEDCEVIVVDNGSDLVPPSKYTTMQITKNAQTTAGWNAGLRMAREAKPDFYWILITSAEFTGTPVLEGMLKCMELYSHCVGVHPALTKDSTTSWEHLKEIGTKGWRQVWMIDNICALWRADWFDSVGGFDSRFRYGWGPDLELSYLARAQERTLYVSEPAGVKKVTDIGYAMQRMGMTAEDRRAFARANMREVMLEKYGSSWQELMYVE